MKQDGEVKQEAGGENVIGGQAEGKGEGYMEGSVEGEVQ